MHITMHLLCASVIIDAVEKGKATPILMFGIHDDFNRAMVQIDAWKNPELLQKGKYLQLSTEKCHS